MVQFPGSGSRHIRKTTKTHDSSNKNLKNWYCSLLQNACEGQPSKDIEKTPLSQDGSCQYLAIPKEKIKNPTQLPSLYHGLAIDVLYFWKKRHKDLFNYYFPNFLPGKTIFSDLAISSSNERAGL